MNIIKKMLLGLIVASQAFAVSVYTLDEQISSVFLLLDSPFLCPRS